jgi:hypothetical protein
MGTTNRRKFVTSPLREAVAAAVPTLLLVAAGPSRTRGDRVGSHSGRRRPVTPIYQVADRLHEGCTVCVPCDEIGTTVSAWLAELGTQSQLAEELAHAVGADDWPTVHAICDRLSVDVTRWTRTK